MKKLNWIFALPVLCVAACSSGEAELGIDPAYVAEIEEWHAERMAHLRAVDGYLNLAGLYWLEAGVSRFGSAADNDVVFPPNTPAHIGEFELTETGVTMTVAPDVDVFVEGGRVESLFMQADTSGEPVTATMGQMAWVVVNRQRQFAVRLRDFEHPALAALPAIPRYEIDAAWRVEGTLIPFDEPKIMNVGTVIEGLGYNPQSPGVIAFEIDGEHFQLDAYQSGEQLFFVFGDQTSGRDTYPAGRFVYAAAPDENGKTMLDFNKSYNPPCAFGDFATCPVASANNRLAVRIEAGEKFIPELHVGSLTSH